MQSFTLALAAAASFVSVANAGVASAAPAAHRRVARNNVSPRTTGVTSLTGSRGGKATFYGGNWTGGMCSFADYPQGTFKGVAIGAQQWFDAASCGSCLRVTGPSGTQDVMVVDQCPECEAGHLDLFQDVANLVNTNAGRDGIFPITWEQIPCAVSGNIQLKNKEGTSAYYFAMQVRNSAQPIEKLEVSTNGGSSYTNIERLAYNYFTSYSGFGETVDVRITASNGEVIIQKGVKISSGGIVAGQTQFSGSKGSAAPAPVPAPVKVEAPVVEEPAPAPAAPAPVAEKPVVVAPTSTKAESAPTKAAEPVTAPVADVPAPAIVENVTAPSSTPSSTLVAAVPVASTRKSCKAKASRR